MDSLTVIAIIAVLILLSFSIFRKSLKLAFKLLLNTVIGFIALIFVNSIGCLHRNKYRNKPRNRSCGRNFRNARSGSSSPPSVASYNLRLIFYTLCSDSIKMQYIAPRRNHPKCTGFRRFFRQPEFSNIFHVCRLC